MGEGEPTGVTNTGSKQASVRLDVTVTKMLHAGGGTAVERASKGSQNLGGYLRRILHYRQMDFEYVFWQMWFLFCRPMKVYRSVKYHKQTKNQWARDDPAFVVVLIFFMSVASLAY